MIGLSSALKWVLRVGLFAAGVVAPGVGLALRTPPSGNVEAGIDGVFWGLIGTVVAAVLFAMTLKTDGVRRLGGGTVFVIAVVATWTLASMSPAIFGHL